MQKGARCDRRERQDQHERVPHRAGLRSEGFALVAAIFILVILSATGALSLRLAGRRQAASSLGLLSTRAYYAARSGLEWGMAQAATGDPCPTANLSLSQGMLQGFSVQIGCQATVHVEGSTSERIIELTATASRGSFGDRDYVSRRAQAMLIAP